MTVIIVERASPGLRGQLTRWMLEVRAGVYVGSLTARVREKLWLLVRTRNSAGGSLLIYRARNEQGFCVESDGDTSRSIFEIDGLQLVKKPLEPAAVDEPSARPKRRTRKKVGA